MSDQTTAGLLAHGSSLGTQPSQVTPVACRTRRSDGCAPRSPLTVAGTAPDFGDRSPSPDSLLILLAEKPSRSWQGRSPAVAGDMATGTRAQGCWIGLTMLASRCCRGLQLLGKCNLYEQDDEQVFTRGACPRCGDGSGSREGLSVALSNSGVDRGQDWVCGPGDARVCEEGRGKQQDARWRAE